MTNKQMAERILRGLDNDPKVILDYADIDRPEIVAAIAWELRRIEQEKRRTDEMISGTNWG